MYPVWIKSVEVQEKTTAWRIDITSHSFNCKTSPKKKRFYIKKSLTQQQAIELAVLKADSIRLHSRGCWIVTQTKAKYGEDIEGRKELFGEFCRQLRRKYDGVNYLYESQEAQDEIIKALKISDMPKISLDIQQEICYSTPHNQMEEVAV